MDNFNIILQFCGDIKWDHIICDIRQGETWIKYYMLYINSYPEKMKC
jgi:hypothetical protein